MPSTASGAHVFVPTQDNTPAEDEEVDDDNNQPIPWPKSPSPPALAASLDSDEDETPPPPTSHQCKHVREPATPTQPVSKCVRGSKNATALETMSTSLSAFSTTIATALNGPLSARIDPTPVRRTVAIKSLINLKKEWLGEDELVALIDFLRTDLTAADTYTTLTGSDVRQAWVRAQLSKLNFIV
ncbi:hypothetical protein BYT27DRAFT_7079232 [Phlegmacium glaucopus]|nr:hypothetical protein BYT27DRAFT_7079232 [Phlegmacium glaucopus]